MIEESRFSLERIILMVSMAFLYLAGILFLVFKNEMLIDEVLCLIFLSIVFFTVFVLTMVMRRMDGRYDGTSYKRVFLVSLLCWVCIVIFSFCPNIFLPFMIIGLLLSCVLDEGISIATAIYFAVIFALVEGINMYFVYGYILLSILGILFAATIKSKMQISKVQIFIFTFALNLSITVVFTYFVFLTLSTKHFYIALAESLGVSLFLTLLFPLIQSMLAQQREASYESLLEPEYPLAEDIKRFSKMEYDHARRVSRLARTCTSAIKGNALAAACGGMYYRLGKIEGRPEIQNAVKLANNHCFPKDVISIMTEYGGIVRKPQTPESAIVHMCDVLVTKMEALSSKESMQSNWNQDMVIYQTLNDYSQRGFYDESGLSMNQFLIVREKMIREESIL